MLKIVLCSFGTFSHLISTMDFEVESHLHQHLCYLAPQEKIIISACMNGIPYINGAREMGVHERIASVM